MKGNSDRSRTAMVAAKICESVCVLTDGADDAVQLLTENIEINGLRGRGMQRR